MLGNDEIFIALGLTGGSSLLLGSFIYVLWRVLLRYLQAGDDRAREHTRLLAAVVEAQAKLLVAVEAVRTDESQQLAAMQGTLQSISAHLALAFRTKIVWEQRERRRRLTKFLLECGQFTDGRRWARLLYEVTPALVNRVDLDGPANTVLPALVEAVLNGSDQDLRFFLDNVADVLNGSTWADQLRRLREDLGLL